MKYLKICPQCGSTNIKIPPAGMDLKMAKRDYCTDCGNWGMFPEVKESELKGEHKATPAQMKDLEIAYKIAAGTKSNCVTYVKNGSLVAIGMGMTSRVDAAQCALKKAKEMGLDVEGAAMASEAFFPFRDSIDAAAAAGVKAVIEPGGSVRDDEVIAAANEHGST